MIYLVDKPNNKIIPCEEADFKALKIFERQHLEKWVESYPAILGEEFLVITTEYDKFDKTNERLDILAIDKDGNLAIIELKRDDSGKNVDLQAIKYAAYCSNLRLDKIVKFYKEHEEKRGEYLTDELAREKILLFISNDDFEEISDRPRIILVSRQFRPEVTASVLWLRKFKINISCIKLTPYDIGAGSIAFESNILIPLPEAIDFIIEAEKPGGLTVSQIGYMEFYTELVNRLKMLIPRNYSTPQPKYYYQIPTGIGSVHYEWSFHGRPRDSFYVEFHFEKGTEEENLELFSHVESKIPQLEEALGERVTIQKDWQTNGLRFFITKPEGNFSEELKDWAVQKMATFYKILQPIFSKLA
jgi:hypothetical protein